MNKKDFVVLIAMLVSFVFVGAMGYRKGYKHGMKDRETTSLATQEPTVKSTVYQDSLDNLIKSGCKNISIKLFNRKNELKTTKLVSVDSIGNTKTIRVSIAGNEKNFEYNGFMSRVVEVQCADYDKW